MIFAAGLALIGMDQIDAIKHEREQIKPRTVAEILQFEVATGKLYKNSGGRQEADPLSSLNALLH
jgi:hypothetical protein